jgi:hypothetical protein
MMNSGNTSNIGRNQGNSIGAFSSTRSSSSTFFTMSTRRKNKVQKLSIKKLRDLLYEILFLNRRVRISLIFKRSLKFHKLYLMIMKESNKNQNRWKIVEMKEIRQEIMKMKLPLRNHRLDLNRHLTLLLQLEFKTLQMIFQAALKSK